MKEKRQFEIEMSNDSVITEENFVKFGEVFAICALKFKIKPTGSRLHKIYRGLVHDVFRDKNLLDESFSDGYDIAQTAMLFLYQHKGKKLGDVIPDKFGRDVTVRRQCLRELDLFIIKQYLRPMQMTVSLNENVKTNGYDKTLDEEQNNDYTAFDSVVERMKLTKGEEETLNHLMSGLSCQQISRMYNVNRTTIWRRRNNLQKKYLLATANL